MAGSPLLVRQSCTRRCVDNSHINRLPTILVGPSALTREPLVGSLILPPPLI